MYQLRSGSPARARVAAATLLLLAGLTDQAAAVDPPRGVQFFEGDRFTFVNKDVDGQRFAITREQDGTMRRR